MSKHTDALKLALEALEGMATWVEMRPKTHPWDTWKRVEPAITAIREALAEQRPQNCGTGYCSCIECPYEQPAQQEPIEEFAYKAITKRGEHCHFGTHTAARIWAGEGGKVETIKLRHLELVEQPAQQQEPLFWYRPCSNGMYEGPIHNAQIERIRKESGAWHPLYTSPPAQRKPLTVDEVWQNDQLMALNAELGCGMDLLMEVVEAIEAAHGITGEQK